MSLLLKIKDDKYRFWNTVADGWSTKFLSREEALQYLRDRSFRRYTEELEREERDFPKGWTDKDTFKII